MSPEIRSRGSGIAMKIMDNYTGIPGRASYLQGSQIRQFTIWSKNDDSEALFYVYVPNARVDHDPALKHVCAKATNVESGFMVKVSQWESMVTPEGVLIPAQP